MTKESEYRQEIPICLPFRGEIVIVCLLRTTKGQSHRKSKISDNEGESPKSQLSFDTKFGFVRRQEHMPILVCWDIPKQKKPCR